jgi:hypothetical protein
LYGTAMLPAPPLRLLLRSLAARRSREAAILEEAAGVDVAVRRSIVMSY